MRLSAWLTTWVGVVVGVASGCDLEVDGAKPPDAGPPATDAPPPPPSDDAAPTPDSGPPVPRVRIVAYLPNWSGSYGDWARRIDFAKMTHLNLAFATPDGNNDWSMGADDDDVRALVAAAHAAGTQVLASLGGGGGDQRVIARYRDAGNIGPLVDKLAGFVSRLGLDGVDIDIEDPNNMGQNYSRFVDATVDALRPDGKLVTAAVAQYLQDSMADETLHTYDFVNVMVYTNYDDSVDQLRFYTEEKHVPADEVTLGAAFFGTDNNGGYYGYSDILRADGEAWTRDQASIGGRTVHYTGVESMKRLAEYSKGFGGIMFWELSLDVEGTHSLYRAIQDTM